jgi:hypothetical protein
MWLCATQSQGLHESGSTSVVAVDGRGVGERRLAHRVGLLHNGAKAPRGVVGVAGDAAAAVGGGGDVSRAVVGARGGAAQRIGGARDPVVRVVRRRPGVVGGDLARGVAVGSTMVACRPRVS